MTSKGPWWTMHRPTIRSRKDAREFASNGEPWFFVPGNDEFFTERGHDIDTHNYGFRMVECVNACAGIPNPAGIPEALRVLSSILGGLSAGTISDPKGEEWHRALREGRAALDGLNADALIARVKP